MKAKPRRPSRPSPSSPVKSATSAGCYHQLPRPQGRVVDKQSPNAHKFCSTRDLFSYYLQPENQRQATQVYVHDMAKSAWGQPDDNHFTDARSAWYVAGSSQRGAMGPTLASFSSQADAEAFAKEFGGRLLTFDDINFELLANL